MDNMRRGVISKKTPAQMAVGEPVENSIGMVLVPIPAGEFMMGSPEWEEDRDDEETQHRVTLTKSFHLGQTEVTQGQWRAVMGTTPWKDEFLVEEDDSYPATYVSWDDAVEFCHKLSEKEGVEYRLPTEAEWEYACRAGTTTVYSFGDDDSELGVFAWYVDNVDVFDNCPLQNVGLKKPNAWGLHDMHGNVDEWCLDLFSGYDADEVIADPRGGPATVSNRVCRGGSAFNHAGCCCSASRDWAAPSWRLNDLGFRVLRSSAK